MDDEVIKLEITLASSDDVRRIEHALATILKHLEKIMSAISDFAVKQNAHNAAVSSDLDSLSTKIDALNGLVNTLQNSPGAITAADQATLDQIETAGNDLATKADALAGKTPPTPPVA